MYIFHFHLPYTQGKLSEREVKNESERRRTNSSCKLHKAQSGALVGISVYVDPYACGSTPMTFQREWENCLIGLDLGPVVDGQTFSTAETRSSVWRKPVDPMGPFFKFRWHQKALTTIWEEKFKQIAQKTSLTFAVFISIHENLLLKRNSWVPSPWSAHLAPVHALQATSFEVFKKSVLSVIVFPKLLGYLQFPIVSFRRAYIQDNHVIVTTSNNWLSFQVITGTIQRSRAHDKWTEINARKYLEGVLLEFQI